MKTLILFITSILLAFSFSQCGTSKKKVEKMPACIQDQINTMKMNTGAYCNDFSVTLYNFQGKEVYVFNPGTCGADMMSPVYDSDCRKLGALGGYAGITTVNGESFSSAELIRVVYENQPKAN